MAKPKRPTRGEISKRLLTLFTEQEMTAATFDNVEDALERAWRHETMSTVSSHHDACRRAALVIYLLAARRTKPSGLVPTIATLVLAAWAPDLGSPERFDASVAGRIATIIAPILANGEPKVAEASLSAYRRDVWHAIYAELYRGIRDEDR